MKNLLVIAMALVSVSAFAQNDAAAQKAAVEACTKENKTEKTQLANCVAEKMKVTTTETASKTTTTTTAPAVKK